MNRVKVQARDLKKGDIVSFDRTIVSVRTQGIDVPSGKAIITYERSNGERRTVTWGRYTKITARRPECSST